MSRSGRLLIDVLDERDAHIDADEDVDVRLLLKQRYSAELNAIERSQKCAICGFSYLPKENFLRYDCRVHTGFLQYDRTWSCCGRFEDTSGCRPSMHASSPAIVRSMRKNAAQSILELPVEWIDYNLIVFNPRMIMNQRGGSHALTHVEDERGQVKRREGYFYFMRRVSIYERVL